MPQFASAALLSGISGLEWAYAAVQVPLALALRHGRARWGQFIASPLVAAPLMLVSSLTCGLVGPQSALGSLVFGTALSAGLGYVTGRFLSRPGPPTWIHQRGALITASRAADVLPSAAARQPSLAGQPVPARDECKHFKIMGTTGTGKSTAIDSLICPALTRGDRLVIADPDGGYLRRFFDASRGDIILNPFDARSVRWDLFAEIRTPYDADHIARSLLPDPQSGDATWTGYARTLLSALLRQSHAAGVKDVGELFRLTSIAPIEELRRLVHGTAAQPFLEEHNARMFDSIRSVTSSAIASLEHVAMQDGRPYSVRDWIAGGHGARSAASDGQVLFLPYRADQIAALRTSVSAWLRLAIFETMAGPEDDRRMWFVIDELDALGRIDGLKDALARLRKFGGRCILGFQSIAQLDSIYGHGDAHTIVENCGNTLILRCSASEGGGTARFAAGLIGQREVRRTVWSRSRRADEFVGSVTRSEQVGLEPAVLDSQIEQLADLSGFLKFASSPNWQRVAFGPRTPYASGRQDVKAFVPAPLPTSTTSMSAGKSRRRGTRGTMRSSGRTRGESGSRGCETSGALVDPVRGAEP